MTHIFNERTKIDAEETAGYLPVELPETEGLDALNLLQEILIELKKVNVHLALMTGREVTEEDTK